MFFPPPQNPPAGPSNSSNSNNHGNGNQRLSAPPSRLSPPPGTSVQELLASTEMSNKGKKKKEDTPKRGYRACVHCRLRKARCDLGDVNSPSEPPCTRCRREQRNCVFLPSVSCVFPQMRLTFETVELMDRNGDVKHRAKRTTTSVNQWTWRKTRIGNHRLASPRARHSLNNLPR